MWRRANLSRCRQTTSIQATRHACSGAKMPKKDFSTNFNAESVRAANSDFAYVLEYIQRRLGPETWIDYKGKDYGPRKRNDVAAVGDVQTKRGCDRSHRV